MKKISFLLSSLKIGLVAASLCIIFTGCKKKDEPQPDQIVVVDTTFHGSAYPDNFTYFVLGTSFSMEPC